MAFKRIDLRTGILLIIFTTLVLIIIYGGLKFSTSQTTITGTLGGSPSAITGMGTYECEYIIEGIQCAGEIYALKTEEGCPTGTVSVCTNICELDRLKVGDDRVCPSHCTEYCLPPDTAQKL